MTQDNQILHFLVPAETLAVGSEFRWNGRLRALERLVMNALLENGPVSHRTAVSENIAHLSRRMLRLEDQYAEIRSQLSIVVRLLNDVASATNRGEPSSPS